MLNTPKWKKYWKEYLEKIDNMNDIKNSLWVEKHRPDSLDGFVGNNHIVEKVKNYIKIGRAHVWTPVTSLSRMPSSAWKKKKKK